MTGFHTHGTAQGLFGSIPTIDPETVIPGIIAFGKAAEPSHVTTDGGGGLEFWFRPGQGYIEYEQANSPDRPQLVTQGGETAAVADGINDFMGGSFGPTITAPFVMSGRFWFEADAAPGVFDCVYCFGVNVASATPNSLASIFRGDSALGGVAMWNNASTNYVTDRALLSQRWYGIVFEFRSTVPFLRAWIMEDGGSVIEAGGTAGADSGPIFIDEPDLGKSRLLTLRTDGTFAANASCAGFSAYEGSGSDGDKIALCNHWGSL